MKMCCRGMMVALAHKDLKLQYSYTGLLIGLEEDGEIVTVEDRMTVNFCPFCGRRVEITFEEDDEQPAEVPEITAIYEIPKDE